MLMSVRVNTRQDNGHFANTDTHARPILEMHLLSQMVTFIYIHANMSTSTNTCADNTKLYWCKFLFPCYKNLRFPGVKKVVSTFSPFRPLGHRDLRLTAHVH